MEKWMLLGGSAYLLYAISTIIDKLFMKGEYKPLCTQAFKMFFDGIIVMVLGMMFFELNINSNLVWWSLLLGTLYGFGGVSYMRALKIKNVEDVIPIFQSSKLLLIFLSAVLFFKEDVVMLNIAGLVLIVAGIYLVLSKKGVHLPSFDRGDFHVGMMVVFSVAYALVAKKILTDAQPIDTVITMYFSSALVLSAYLFASKKHRCHFTFKSAKIALSAIFGATGTFLLYSALSIGAVSKVFSLSGLHSVFVFFLALIFLKEKFCWYKLAGTLTVFLGIYLISA